MEDMNTMIKRIGMLTSGGDCQALNATMRGVVKGLTNNVDELEVYGFDDGYKGLIYGKYRMLTSKDFSGILTHGGTILGTSRQPFKLMRVPDANGLDKVEAMKQTYYKLCLDCLVILGGNGTQKTANLLREEGLNIIHLPKTIDNDIFGTDMTFGFQSAVNIATNAIVPVTVMGSLIFLRSLSCYIQSSSSGYHCHASLFLLLPRFSDSPFLPASVRSRNGHSFRSFSAYFPVFR